MIKGINKKDYSLLLDTLKIQTNSTNEKLMVLYLHKVLSDMGLQYGIDAAGNVLVVKGKASAYPCIVSHMDTVHSFVNNFTVVERPFNYVDTKTKKKIREDIELTAKGGDGVQCGIGGDDKCGVFACLYFLKTLPAVKVVFFSREEVGCRGSGDVNHNFFEDCRYIIQLDRKGKHDFITNYCSDVTVNHELSSEIGLVKKKWKFKKATGSVTDSVKLWYNNIGVSCMNISSGYYSPHTPKEYVSVSDLFHAIWFVNDMIHTLKNKQYKSKPKPIKKWTPTYYGSTSINNTERGQCSKCYVWKNKTTGLYLHQGKLLCYSCLNKAYTTPNSNKPDNDTVNSGDTLLFATECFKCERLLNECKSLKLIGKHYYCPKCKGAIEAACANPLPEDKDTLYTCFGCHSDISLTSGKILLYSHGHNWCYDCYPFSTYPNHIDATNNMVAQKLGKEKDFKCALCDFVITNEEEEYTHYINGAKVCSDCYGYSQDEDNINTNFKE